MHVTTHALVLRQVHYKESDLILTLLTQDLGKLTVSARGSRRKNSALAAGCQLLCWSEMVLYEFQGRWQVKEATAQRQFSGLRDELERLALGCYFGELAELLALEGEPAPQTLALTLNSLHMLDRQPDYPVALVKAAFELRLMCIAGYTPSVMGCAVCGKNLEEGQFHLREGGLHCPACRTEMGEGISLPLGPGALAALRHVVQASPKRIFSFHLGGEEQRQLSSLAEGYVLTQMERGFRTLDFLKQITLSSL